MYTLFLHTISVCVSELASRQELCIFRYAAFAAYFFILKGEKEMKQKLTALLLLLALAVGLVGCGAKKQETFVWEELPLAAKLPPLGTNVGHISYNSDDTLSIRDIPCTQAQWSEYVEKCRALGFTIEEEKKGTSFEAFNPEGYEVYTYISSGEEMSLRIEAPMEMGELQWPRSELAALIPAVPTDVGKLSTDRADRFFLYAANMDRDAFRAYVDQCAEAGFTVDYESYDDYYHAFNSDGCELRVEYTGFQIVTVELEAPDEDWKAESAAETAAPTEEPVVIEETPEPSAQPAAGVRAEFKEAMDSYEAFFDEYAAFMKSYDSSSASLDQLSKYFTMLSRYSEAMTALDELSEEDMSDAETLYYTEVMSRITAKLLEAAQ